MNTKVLALLLIAAIGASADEFNCGAEGRVCQNGGVCAEPNLQTPGAGGTGWQTPVCICKAPYGGPDCSYTIRECKDSPCQNGATCNAATCVPGDGTAINQYDCFTCTCAPGWTGSPANRASSTNARKYGVCDWPLPVGDCTVPRCYNGGNCTAPVNTPSSSTSSCICHPEWTGANCTVPTCMSGAPCQNGGTCMISGGVYQCRCPAGFQGNQCELEYCAAGNNPCQNGGTCNPPGVGIGNTGSCTCDTTQWRGSTCSTPRYCLANGGMGPCQNGATCFDNGGQSIGGSCSCVSSSPLSALGQFGGDLCEVPQWCSVHTCQNGGTCIGSINGGGSCACVAGFGGRYCETEIKGCGATACAVGHTSSGCQCTNQNTCANNNWNDRCNCDARSYDCRCNSTFVSRCPGSSSGTPGRNVDMVCSNGAMCVEHADGTYCSCRAGFWGPSCENYDNPCLNNPCQNQGRCSIISDTGKRFSYANGGMVSLGNIALDDRFWGYQCTCKWPYYGVNCELRASYAETVCGANNSPCQNGGTCGPQNYDASFGNMGQLVGNWGVVGGTYTCQCNANFTGVNCEIPVVTCENTPGYCGVGFCVNGAGDMSGSRPHCQCPCGYTGDRCEMQAGNVDPVAVRKFENVRGGVGYRLDFCSAEPCQNGGTCVHSLNGQDFWCVCKSGWGDRYCQTRVRSSASGVVPSILAVAAAVAAAFALKH